ncbi:hypothetical protein AJ79_00436 [Helicocarpus griseus UAMH5409]|uniref:Uncharacterized protein n=1 Tax=Helicocarpus griseus UAMH5409 TaxID=1447875 RepID=A0A2B7YB13_9EURO|nr:hypothetical protein AJ79_00436 [Helicocarpus griseus UAMH5409]
MDTQDVSGMPEYEQLLQNQKALLLSAQARKGQWPEKTKSRMELVMKFQIGCLMGNRVSNLSGHHQIRSSFVPPAYDPCVKPLNDLKKLMLKDLLWRLTIGVFTLS